MNARIRPGTPDDADRIVVLSDALREASIATDPRYAQGAPGQAERVWRVGAMRDGLAGRVTPPPQIQVAERAPTGIVGFVLAAPISPITLQIQELYVLPEDRRGGVGRALVEALLAGARAAGLPRASLGTLAAGSATLAFWMAMGFRPYWLEMRNDPDPAMG